MELQRILGTDTGKAAFYKADENFTTIQAFLGALKAGDIKFDNEGTGLTAEDVQAAIVELQDQNIALGGQIDNLDAKTKILYAKFYNGPQNGLDNIALNVFGITTPSNLIFKVTVNESAPPYLFAGSAYEVEEYAYTNLYKAQTAISYGGNTKVRRCTNGVWTAWQEIPTIETGSWTPIFTPQTGSFNEITYHEARRGGYVRIGSLCYIYGFIRTTTLDKGTASGFVYITGLPFPISEFSVLACTEANGWASNPPVQLLANANKLTLRKSINGNSADNTIVADLATIANANNVTFSGVYKIQ